MPTLPRDIADQLETEAAVAATLDACLEDGDPKRVAAALGDIARAEGITDLAARTGLPDTTIESFGVTAPDVSAILKVVEALGSRLAVHPKPAQAA